jgi:hypothetical protein
MKIYAVKPDSNYRLMFPEDSIYDSEHWEFKCESLAGKLPLHFEAYFSDKNNKPIPDIAWIGMKTFAFREEVATELLDILEESGELLPFKVYDQQWYCFNVLKKADSAIDHEKSKYEVEEDGMRFGLKEAAFITDKLPESPLFKIQDDNYTTTYCIDKRESDEEVLNNFFCAVSRHGYTGLKFEDIY